MAKYRKKPVVIEAVQLLWTNWGEMCKHAGVGLLVNGKPEGCYLNADNTVSPTPSERMGLTIPTLEGVMIGAEGDWIIRGINGELYPCKPDIFAKTYEPAE